MMDSMRDVDLFCGTGESFTLTEEQRRSLADLIETACRPQRYLNHSFTSYRLKHCFENVLGFYVSNADAKRAMVEAGYRFRPYEWGDGRNWLFNVSNSSLNRLMKISKGRT